MKKKAFGYIAEEVEQVLPELCDYNDVTGKLAGVQYERLAVLLLEEVKKLRSECNIFKNVLLGHGLFQE